MTYCILSINTVLQLEHTRIIYSAQLANVCHSTGQKNKKRLIGYCQSELQQLITDNKYDGMCVAMSNWHLREPGSASQLLVCAYGGFPINLPVDPLSW